MTNLQHTNTRFSIKSALLFMMGIVVVSSGTFVALERVGATGGGPWFDTKNLTIDDKSFKWVGPPAISHYTVTFCDGTSTGKVETDHAKDVETFSFDKRIAKVDGKGGKSRVTKEQTCKTEEPKEDPKHKPAPQPPVCPIEPKEGRTIVKFNDRIRSDWGADHAFSDPVSTSIPAGTYSVTLIAWDGYDGRENISQPKEQYRVQLKDGHEVVATTGASQDVPDKVREATVETKTDHELVVSKTINKVVAAHAHFPHDNPNSLNPICASFDKKADPEPEPEPEPAPEAPSCPIEPKDGRTIVTFTDRIRSDQGEAKSETQTKSVDLKKGMYSVTLVSWDGYIGREHVSQPNEAWKVVMTNDDGYVTHTQAIKDVPDQVREKMIQEEVHTKNFEVKEDVTKVQGKHAVYPDKSSPNSLNPICAAFDKVPETKPDPKPDPKPAPECTMTVADSTIKKGETTTLSWTGKNVHTVTIDQGVGVVLKNDSKDIAPTKNTTYTGTFEGEDGKTVTCSATVKMETVRSGGGGSNCINCDDRRTTSNPPRDRDEEPEPEISVATEVFRATPGSFIYLDQVPYTGFEAGPVTTALFWLGLFVLSALISYLIVVKKVFHRMVAGVAGGPVAQWNGHQPTLYTDTRPQAYRQRVAVPLASPLVTPYAFQLGSSDDVSNDAHGSEKVERIAQEESILFSPEALSYIAGRVEAEGENILHTVIERAKETYPREDGWILLSIARIKTLLDENNEAPAARAEKTEEPAREERTFSRIAPEVRTEPAKAQVADVEQVRVPVARAAQPQARREERAHQYAAPTEEGFERADIVRFIGWLVEGKQQEAFDFIRKIGSQGHSVEVFVAAVVRDLDEVYKHRIEGDRKPDTALVRETATWTNGDFERILGILVECVDYSYSSNRIGTKVALAKAFEFFARKNG